MSYEMYVIHGKVPKRLIGCRGRFVDHRRARPVHSKGRLSPPPRAVRQTPLDSLVRKDLRDSRAVLGHAHRTLHCNIRKRLRPAHARFAFPIRRKTRRRVVSRFIGLGRRAAHRFVYCFKGTARHAHYPLRLSIRKRLGPAHSRFAFDFSGRVR